VSANLQGANLISISYGEHINPEVKQPSSTQFPIAEEKQATIHCLTDNDKLPICTKYDEKDTQTLNKITTYWVNDLACSDQWIAQVIINNYWWDDKFKTYLIPLFNKKLSDKTCAGIQNLPDETKQQIILANKPTNKN
jgi:hypothetical protein